MVHRVPGEGRYAQVEREQRWLVSEPPAGAERLAEIHDRYLVGTRLRLRRVDAAGDVTYKLAQKVRPDEADPEVVKLTNLYLSVEEYDAFAALPAAELRKTRWRVTWGGRSLAVDELHDRHEGLVLAEVELGAEEPLLPAPPFAVRDVTHDDRFSGGALAFASPAELAELLR